MNIGRVAFSALGTRAELVLTEPAQLPAAECVLRQRLEELDAACSRFRADSELSGLQQRAGTRVRVSRLLFDALSVALRAARLTEGLVDPTVGDAISRLGYDRDFALLDRDRSVPSHPATPVPGWQRLRLDPVTREVLIPQGVRLDLGATAKAWAADRAAAELARLAGCGVLVGLGGDIAVAGPPPAEGWRIVLGEDHARTDPDRDPTVVIGSGGLATSSTTVRTWRRCGRVLHHIVDPRTGDLSDPAWRTVSVAAATCLDANTATTAAIVIGHDAAGWLAQRGLPALLISVDGEATAVGGWPADPRRPSATEQRAS
ncbi:FAD:protein FMN transferase [Flindersiella endophytica]